MAYLVLARKYRPQTLAEVIGQTHITKTLQNAFLRKRLHHAFLFCGSRGTGKTTTARILAKMICCEKNTQAENPEPCNLCATCIEITQGSCVDVQEIDAASQNKVEDVHKLRDSIRYAPVRGQKKIFILDEVHMLSTSAFNALLKTLEEPPPHAIFIFATTDPQKLPQTILSRVQRYDFKLVATPVLVEHLKHILQQEKISFEESALVAIAREGNGSVRDSLSLLDQILVASDAITEKEVVSLLGIADRTFILSLTDIILKQDGKALFEHLAKGLVQGYDPVQIAHALLAHLRDLLFLEQVKSPELQVSETEKIELQKQVDNAGGALEVLFQRLLRLCDEISRSTFPRYALEIALLELTHCMSWLAWDEVISRLETIEKSLLGSVKIPSPPSGTNSGSTSSRVISNEAPRKVVSPSVAPIEKENTQIPAVIIDPEPIKKMLPPWPEVAKLLVDKEPLLHPIAMSKCIKFDEKTLALTVENSFNAEQVLSKKKLLEDLIKHEFGYTPKLEIKVIETNSDQVNESMVEAEQRSATEQKDHRRKTAQQHPARQILQDTFGAGELLFEEPIINA